MGGDGKEEKSRWEREKKQKASKGLGAKAPLKENNNLRKQKDFIMQLPDRTLIGRRSGHCHKTG